MEDLQNLQRRVDNLLITSPRPPSTAVAPTSAPHVTTAVSQGTGLQHFSPFDSVQMKRVTEILRQFMILANSAEGAAGLKAVLDEADKLATTENPELVRYALMLFITHHPQGNQLKLKPLEVRAPQVVLASKTPLLAQMTAAILLHPSEASLKWFREDPKANEHHEHWHLVYPAGGIPDPHRPDDPNAPMITKDRQGELFIYMHEQMLARYDAERVAAGLAPVKPLDYTETIQDGYDPDPNLEVDAADGQNFPFARRDPGKRMGDLPGLSVATLKRWGDNLMQAAKAGKFRDGTPVTPDTLGSTTEANVGSVDPNHEQPDSFYGNHHNMGHIFLAYIDDPQHANNATDRPGVMSQTRTAIRDFIFFRWHKHIDDISFLWQEHQPANDFSDAPHVRIRKGLHGATPAHQSPDIILAFKDAIHNGSDDSDASWQAYGEQHFGGANWDKDFSSTAGTINQLQTAMRQRTITFVEDDQKTETLDFLYPREFFSFLRAENLVNEAKDVTVRIFLVPTGPAEGITELSEDRRKWIEMDKFRHTLQPLEKAVIFRRAEDSSVIRRPALKTFAPITIPNPADDADDDTDPNCDCGWPYNLLLPRGKREGMTFRLMVMITDWNIDQVPDETSCGSMSYCGAKDKYPDSRAMGYPFDRPFNAGRGIAQTIAAHDNMAARDITIKWVDTVPSA
ncbi:MAG: hypothetical protein JOZ18_11845 [Chloroflexi bacterium]|nr:hypothetical protein [Chloroflexota bacterium]